MLFQRAKKIDKMCQTSFLREIKKTHTKKWRWECEGEYDKVYKRVENEAIISLVHGNTNDFREKYIHIDMYKRARMSRKAKITKPEQESNLYLLISGRLFHN